MQTSQYPNPYKTLRLNLSLTQRELASLSNVTQQVVANLESGLYYKPPRSIHDKLIRLTNQPLWSIHEDYVAWQSESRRAHGEALMNGEAGYLSSRPNPETLSQMRFEDWMLGVHPKFRGFCRVIVYQPSMLQEYIDRGLNSRSLRQALSETLWPFNKAGLVDTIMKLEHGSTVTAGSLNG